MYKQYLVTSTSQTAKRGKRGLEVYVKAPVCLNGGGMPALTTHALTMNPKHNTCQTVGEYALMTLLHILGAPLLKFVSVILAVPLHLHLGAIPATNTLYIVAWYPVVACEVVHYCSLSYLMSHAIMNHPATSTAGQGLSSYLCHM